MECKHGLKPAVPCWFNFDTYPNHLMEDVKNHEPAFVGNKRDTLDLGTLLDIEEIRWIRVRNKEHPDFSHGWSTAMLGLGPAMALICASSSLGGTGIAGLEVLVLVSRCWFGGTALSGCSW